MGKLLPARLKKAREDAGLTQESFARALGLSSEFISLLEAGKRAPSLDTLSRIAAYFNKEPAFKVLFRAPAIDLSPQVRVELERFKRYAEDYLCLEEATGRRLETAPLYSGPTSPEKMAAEERRRLGLGDEPIRDIFALLEHNGLRILRVPMPPDVEIIEGLRRMACFHSAIAFSRSNIFIAPPSPATRASSAPSGP
jgi:transcriptional regulator with XRE-family HTH domain